MYNIDKLLIFLIKHIIKQKFEELTKDKTDKRELSYILRTFVKGTDEACQELKEEFLNMIQINEKLVKYNFSKRTEGKIKYIVIHDTGNTDKGADAEAHFTLHNRGDRGASAHYFVDDKQILRIIKDEDRSWAVGDGRGKYGITNENSLNIEMCINSDGDFNKTYLNTLRLTKYLMEKYNIPLENVVRHYDASRKLCPNVFKENNWEKWNIFKKDLIAQDHSEYIIEIYKAVLKREPDEEGLRYWKVKIINDADFGKFVKEVLNSDEYKKLKLE